MRGFGRQQCVRGLCVPGNFLEEPSAFVLEVQVEEWHRCLPTSSLGHFLLLFLLIRDCGQKAPLQLFPRKNIQTDDRVGPLTPSVVLYGLDPGVLWTRTLPVPWALPHQGPSPRQLLWLIPARLF